MKNKQLFLVAILLSSTCFSYADTYIGLFGDFSVQDNEDASFNSDSYSGVLDLYVTHQFNEKSAGLLELVYDNSKRVEELETERLWLRYEIAETFNISAGRFHSRLGSWNELMNHAALLQDTISSPFFIELRGNAGVLPTHISGLLADGVIRTGSININYDVSLHGEQEIETIGDDGNFGIEPKLVFSGSDDIGYSARIALGDDEFNRHLAVFIMQADISKSSGVVLPIVPISSNISQLISGIGAGAKLLDWEISAEYFHIKNDIENTVFSYKADAYFAQATYQSNETSIITYRYSGISVDKNDPYFKIFAMTNQNHHIAALRYGINDAHAIKFELDYVDFSDDSLSNTLTYKLQWAFLFN